MKNEVTKQIRVYGIVQGVGFRPTVSRHAATHQIRGSVSNKGPYVEIFAQGPEEAVDGFISDIENKPPKRAAILKMNIEPVEEAEDFPEFAIIESEKTKGEIFVSPDIAICDECKEEMFDPKNRRYLHPFINCTCCGPRLTILDALPYDRERTSMKEFPMCPDCAKEYYDPATRRYDAQPVCCNECGPEVYLIGREERGRDAIIYTRRIIAEGGIVAIKGIGGFHLCCDATNEKTVRRLRELKKRPAKPFAVMAKDLESVKRECLVSEEQEKILTGHQKPILLLDKKEDGKETLCESIAPGNPKVGVMLPYAPVQLLIFTYDDGIQMPSLLVMTSGNTSGAPICREDKEAIQELSHLCDCMLSHNRKIRIRADDSVMDFYKNEPYMIRRSRGYAPLPTMVQMPWKGQVLATGGELKNTFCIGVDSRFYQSPYVGDLEDLRTVQALTETIGRLETLLEAEPKVVACDLHPKYNATVVAEELGLPVLKVQHHFAHILSCMAENDCEDPVIGISFDGTGYGTDGTIWGGEILRCDYSGFKRLGSIKPFWQVGGDLSAKEGWRIAGALLYEELKDKEKTIEWMKKLELCTEAEAKVLVTMTGRHLNAVLSTSAGRLFDGVSAILGIRKKSTFEGEASTALEFAAEAYEKTMQHPYEPLMLKPFTETAEERMILNTGELVKMLAEKRLAGEDAGKLAYEFHQELARQIISAALTASHQTAIRKVALSGGVFQNRLLLRLVEEGMVKQGLITLHHHLIPPNDGGLALGQAAYAMAYLQKHEIK